MPLITRAKVRLGLLWLMLPVAYIQQRLFFPVAQVLFPGIEHDYLTDQQWDSIHRLYTAWTMGGLVLLLCSLAAAIYNFRRLKKVFPQAERPYATVRLLNLILIIALGLFLLATLFIPRGAVLG